ncbi:hypothetical protein DEU56DRAFT_828756, partial [Suillus clintonianus]|uniref:uncharacterized protein n=1 Tax=Suillus clintonianus TaxID=1904413 RepID=UPI001B85F7FE
MVPFNPRRVSPHCPFSHFEFTLHWRLQLLLLMPTSYQYEIHTHAPASSILYHIGKGALKATNSRALELSNANARHWVALTAPQVKQKLPRLKISGGRITKA